MHRYDDKIYFVDESLRNDFRSGGLRDQWYSSYPMLFDEIDYQISKNQPLYHFFEWQAAIFFYEKQGLLSLVEKFEFGKHKRQHALFLEMVPSAVIDLHKSETFRYQQFPDLFVYSLDHSKWFFCEVKGGADKIRPVQEKFFNELEQITGRTVELIQFKLLKNK